MHVSNLWVAVISAGAALAGVLLADVRQRGREYNDRLAALRREAFVDAYAWALKADETLDAVAIPILYLAGGVSQWTEIESPPLSPELLARLRIYLDTEIASAAKSASVKLSAAIADVRRVAQDASATSAHKLESAHKLMDSTLEVSRSLGVLRALIEIRVKHLDTTKATRLRWWFRRVLRPPLSTDDPPWSGMPLRERWSRRTRELRRPSRPSARRDPLTQRGIDAPL